MLRSRRLPEHRLPGRVQAMKQLLTRIPVKLRLFGSIGIVLALIVTGLVV